MFEGNMTCASGGGDGSALAPVREGVQEAQASDAASAADRHAQHLENDAAAAGDGSSDGNDVEGAVAAEGGSLVLMGAASGSGQASAPDSARAVPSGVAGGGGELEGEDSDASGDGDVDRWGRVVTPAVAARRAAQAQARKAAAALPWDTAYYACTLLQRLWEAHPRVLSEAAAGGSGSGATPGSGTKRRRKAGKAQESDATTAVTLHSALWTSLDALTDIMVFPHAWVRAAAARWLGAVLNTVAVASVRSCPPPPGVAAWLAGNERLFALARAACVQLADGTLSTEQGTALAPVLLFTAVGLYATTPPSSRNTIPPHLAERTARLAGKSTLLVGGVEVVGGKAVQRDSLLFTRTAHDDDDDGGARDSLFWLLQRLSNTAVHKGGPAATTVLNVFGAMAGHLPQADLQRYVVPVARAVFRTVQAAEHVASDPRLADAPSWSERAQQAAAAAEAGALASEVMEAVQAAMGADVFLTAYNGERRARAAAKERRAKQVAQEAVVNPAAAAARRSRKAQAKKRHVAKRMDKLKVLRGGGGKGTKWGREE